MTKEGSSKYSVEGYASSSEMMDSWEPLAQRNSLYFLELKRHLASLNPGIRSVNSALNEQALATRATTPDFHKMKREGRFRSSQGCGPIEACVWPRNARR